MIWKYDKIVIEMNIMYSHIVLNLDLMFRDHGTQVECFEC